MFVLSLISVGVVAAMAHSATGAMKTGGSSIAQAPVVLPATTYNGDTSQAVILDYNHWEFWKVALLNGDKVTFDWKDDADTSNFFAFWGPSATDYNFHDDRTVYDYQTGDGPQSHEFVFNVKRGNGVYPFAFFTSEDCLFCVFTNPGPYHFVFYVRHAIQLNLQPLSVVSRSGRVVVGAQAGDGSLLSNGDLKVGLWGLWSKKWHRLAQATPANGKLVFRLHLSKTFHGKQIRLTARYPRGQDWQAANSQVRKVRIK